MPEPLAYVPEGPQPLVRDIPQGDAYPVHALGPLRAAVEAAHDISQAPLAIAAQSALSVASLAVQGFANVETLGGAAPSSLFCLTIAQSGERKSSCDRLLMQGLRDYEAAAAIEYEVLQADHAVAREVWQAKHKSLLTDLAVKKDKVKATAAEADLRALGPEPRPPPYPHLTAQEPTFEGLLKL